MGQSVTAQRIEVRDLHDGQVRELVLGPPPANIISAALMSDLAAALETAAATPRCKLIMIRGAGRHFSYGASVEEHLPATVPAMLPAFHRLIGAVLAHPVPVAAVVEGLCLGGGFELALACHHLWADETAQFAVPEIQLAVFPPPACALLPLKGGDTLANRMILTGEKLRADELARAGVVSWTAPAGTLTAAVETYVARHVLPHSASSLRFAAEAARLGAVEAYRATIDRLERLYLDRLMSTHDAREGIQAFTEKRPARWQNR